MKLSIIIPVYNAEKYLTECLRSVFDQKIDSFEVICIDDGSTDNSTEIIRSFQKSHDNLTLYQQSNQGPSAARNKGLRLAKGDYIFFLDNDDTFLSTSSLNEILSLAYADNIDICVFNALINGEHPFLCPFPNSHGIVSGPELMTLFYKTCNTLMIPIWSHLYRKDFLIENHLQFNESFLVEDILFSPIVQYCAKKTFCLDVHLVNYRWLRPGAITSSSSPKKLIDRRNTGRELYNWFTASNIPEDAPYQTIFSVYIELISSIQNAKLRLSDFLSESDYAIIHNCIRTTHDRKCYRLLRISPNLMIHYLNNTLPVFIRKVINHFL